MPFQAADCCPAVRNPTCVCGRHIVGRIKLEGDIQVRQYLLDNRRFAYLTRPHYHLNKLPRLFKPILNQLIFRSFIHTHTIYSVDLVFLLSAKVIISLSICPNLFIKVLKTDIKNKYLSDSKKRKCLLLTTSKNHLSDFFLGGYPESPYLCDVNSLHKVFV